MAFQPFNGAVQGVQNIKDKATDTVTTMTSEEEVFETIGGVDSRDVASDPVPDTNEGLLGFEDTFGMTPSESQEDVPGSDQPSQNIQDLINGGIPNVEMPDLNVPEVNGGLNGDPDTSIFNGGLTGNSDSSVNPSGLFNPFSDFIQEDSGVLDKVFSLKGVAVLGVIAYIVTNFKGGNR